MDDIDYDAIWPMITLEQVLEHLPRWMQADFDCPGRGPHTWLPRVTGRGNSYEFCRHCTRLKREVDPEWLATRSVYGIYA